MSIVVSALLLSNVFFSFPSQVLRYAGRRYPSNDNGEAAGAEEMQVYPPDKALVKERHPPDKALPGALSALQDSSRSHTWSSLPPVGFMFWGVGVIRVTLLRVTLHDYSGFVKSRLD